MQILSKFCHNKHLTLDGATYNQRDCCRERDIHKAKIPNVGGTI